MTRPPRFVVRCRARDGADPAPRRWCSKTACPLSILALVACAAALAGPRSTDDARPAQPLPQGLEVALSLATGTYAAVMQHAAAGPDESIRVYAVFDNRSAEKTVTLHWQYRKGSADPGTWVQTGSVPFAPTAVCARAGRDRILYVAGWNEQGLLVEEWKLSDVALGVSEPVGGGTATTVLVEDSMNPLRKRVVFSSAEGESLGPASGIACNPFGDKLLLLPVHEPRRIHVVDTRSASVETVIDLPDNSDVWSLKAGLHLDHGLVVAMRDRPTWAPALPAIGGVVERYTLVLVDTNLDGAVDYEQLLEISQVPVAFHPARWDADFSSE